MGIFSKVSCIICEKEVGLNRSKTAEGHICIDCFNASGYNMTSPIKNKKIFEIKNDMIKHEEYKNKVTAFVATKSIGSYIEFDESKRQWIVRGSGLFKIPNPPLYSYDDIVDFELLEDGESITKGGLGSALVGGLLLGGAGAIVGGITGKKNTKSVINNLKIKITVNDFQNPAVYIDLITTQTKADSWMYKQFYKIAQDILSALSLIKSQNESIKVNASNSIPSSADEIFKYKELLNSGIITQDEFEAKKKQLLGL